MSTDSDSAQRAPILDDDVVARYVGERGAFAIGLPPRDLTSADLRLARMSLDELVETWPNLYQRADSARGE